MKAVRFHRYGGPDELVVEEVPEPTVPAGAVRVRVVAAALNPIDWKLRRGDLRGAVDPELPFVPGRDAVGVVEAVGEGVDPGLVGTTVFGSGGLGGLHAEQAVLTAWAAPSARWSAPEAASAALAATTALHALAAVDVVRPGTLDPGPVAASGGVVLVDGAVGAVGHAAVAFAVAAGATVVGTAREEYHRVLTGLGARAVPYGPGLADRVREAAPDGVAVAVDASGASLGELVSLVGEPQRVVTVTDPAGAQALGAKVAHGENDAPLLEVVARAGDAGVWTPRVWRTWPLAQAAEAYAAAETGGSRGKVVLTVE